jgi:tetratricopeptide (TPR) repeat protein
MKKIISLLVLCICLLGFATTSLASQSNIKSSLKDQLAKDNNTTTAAPAGINGNMDEPQPPEPTPEERAKLLKTHAELVAALSDPKHAHEKDVLYCAIALNDMALRDYTEAIKYFDKSIVMHPDNVILHFGKMAAIGYGMPDSEERNVLILKETESLVQYHPEIALFRFFRIEYNKKLKHYDAVLADTATLLSMTKDNAEAKANIYFEQAEAYFHLHNYTAAKDNFAKTASLTSNKEMQSICKNNMAMAYKEMGQYEQALKMVNEALAMDEKLVCALDTKGDILVCQKRYQEGLTYLDKAIELEDTDGDIYYNRGRAYEGLQDIPKAIADYEKAVELKAAEHEKDASARLAVLKK